MSDGVAQLDDDKLHPRRKVLVPLRRALEDTDLLGNALPGPSWARWRAMLLATVGEELTDEELLLFQESTGRERSPSAPVEEAAFVIGRRGGKDRAASVLAAYFASLCDYSGVLAPGETGRVICLGADTRQAALQLDYIEAAFRNSKLLSTMVVGRTQDVLSLSNGIDVESRAASFRRLRGVTAVCVIASEVCFWQSDELGANPDTEILNAVRPSLATTGGPLILISSPYRMAGELHEIWKRDFGPNGDERVLVAQGASRMFNPTLPESVVTRAMERDEASARAEFLGFWRDDVSGWASRELIESAVDPGVVVRPPRDGISYVCGVDPSGGVRDSFTASIAHMEGDVAVLDCLVEIKAPFKTDEATRQIAETIKSYGCRSCIGDKYGAGWVVSAFAKHGLDYQHSERDRSAIYLDCLPLFTSGRVRIVDNRRLTHQFASLERRTSATGRDRCDHGPSGADDACNSAALAMVLAASAEPEAATPTDWSGVSDLRVASGTAMYADRFCNRGGF